ncbi:hypothetical protein TKK_0010672 [Trichogramma kaykai]|uniref:Peptidase S1 domain-containing protein n=1 Tax=Trichogramma kaykai TaxID=54128 RepID=A0ABD2WW59_9HYME
MNSKIYFSLFLGLKLIVLINSKKLRIIEGEYALPGQFPHQVSIQAMTLDNCTDHLCGGSIIDEWHILTAAHCFTDEFTHQFVDMPLTVVAGTVDLLNRSSGIYHDVLVVFIPFSYTLNGVDEFNHDIAILKLRDPLPLGSHPYLGVVNLPASDQYLPPDNQTAIVSGFGVYNQTDGPYFQIISSPKSRYLKFNYGTINVPDRDGCLDTQVCVESLKLQKGYLEGACYGDSGGPLYDETTNTLIGVVSSKRYEWCGNISRFTRVSAHLDFIHQVVADKIDSTILYSTQSHYYGSQYHKYTVCDMD